MSQEAHLSTPKKIKLLGGAITLMALFYTLVSYVDLAADASTNAFAFLVFIEGGFVMLVGLIIVLVGYRMEKKAARRDPLKPS